MRIKSTAKALIINEGKLLLNKCHDKLNGYYYSLPGASNTNTKTCMKQLCANASRKPYIQ